MNYYKSELDKLNLDTEYPLTIKISDSEGNSTKALDINLESIEALTVFLFKIQRDLQTRQAIEQGDCPF